MAELAGIDNTTAHEVATPMQSAPTGPLVGVRVIDVTHAIAGPWCGMLLADLGADVIKIESPSGDMNRYLPPYTLDDEVRAYGGAFGTYNRNKRSIMLDLTTEADRDIFSALAESADAVIENQRAGVLDRLGVGYEVLAARNPKLVYGAVRGFGDPRTGDSPSVDWPAFDVIAQAQSGFVAQNGTAEGEQLKAGPFIGDIYPGTMAALAVCAAILHARETGRGQFCDVGMVDSMMMLSELGVMRYSYLGRLTPPTGNTSGFQVPFDLFPTKDGSCAIAGPSDAHWALLVEAMGRHDLNADERMRSAGSRVKHRDIVDAAVRTWCASLTTKEVVAALGGKVPVAPVNSPADLFEDPYVLARKMLVAVEQPSGRPVVQVNTPMRFTQTPAGVYRRAPKLDEHRAELLTELGLTD